MSITPMSPDQAARGKVKTWVTSQWKLCASRVSSQWKSTAEAFLAPHVLVCEGATEVGLARGLDLYWADNGGTTLASHSVALADGGGSNFVARALCFARLGYRTALWRDSDVRLPPEQHRAMQEVGVAQFTWRPPFSTEQQLFDALPEPALYLLIEIAASHLGQDAVGQHVRNIDANCDLEALMLVGFDDAARATLGRAAGRYKWFKTVDQGERVGREVLGPHLNEAAHPLPAVIQALRVWIGNLPSEAGDEF